MVQVVLLKTIQIKITQLNKKQITASALTSGSNVRGFLLLDYLVYLLQYNYGLLFSGKLK